MERATRTPRMARAIKPGEGVLAWKAYRDRQNQDLLHRTEYLTTIVSAVAEVEAPPGQDLRAALATDSVLNGMGVMGEHFSWGHAKDGSAWAGLALQPEKRRFPRAAWPQEVSPQLCHLMNMSSTARAFHRPEWQKAAVNAAEIAAGQDVPNRDGHAAHVLKGHQNLQDACWQVSAMLDSLPRTGPVLHNKAQHRINVNCRKVKPVPGVHADAFQEDHLGTAQFQQQRKLSAGKVVRVSEVESPLDTAAEMDFVRFYTALMYNGETVVEKSGNHMGFIRLDGLEVGSLHKFSIIEGGLCVRRDYRLPRCTMPPAIVTSMEPVPVFKGGHYFEVSVQSLFQSISSADRPRVPETIGRRAGLVLGFRASQPYDQDELADDVSRVSSSWCLSANGFFFMQAGPAPPSVRRPVSQMRSTPEVRPPWHRTKPLPSEIGLCPWPPYSKGPGTLARQCDWSVALNEADVLGLLALPSGALVLTVNGRRELAVADAGVPTNRFLYPLVQVGGHIKAVRLRPKVPPPGEDAA